MEQFIHDWIRLTQGEMFIKYWHLWLFMVLIVLLISIVVLWWHDDIFKQNRDNQWQDGGFTTEVPITGEEAPYPPRMDNVSKQPHIRIEFDDIRDVPKVLVDGERVDSFVNGKWVSRINIDWRDNTKTINHKSFDIRYVKVDDNGANETALAQNNMA